jgi:hypothetical protein
MLAATAFPNPSVNVELSPIVTFPRPLGSRPGSDSTVTSLRWAPDRLRPEYEPGAMQTTVPPDARATADDSAGMLETVVVHFGRAGRVGGEGGTPGMMRLPLPPLPPVLRVPPLLWPLRFDGRLANFFFLPTAYAEIWQPRRRRPRPHFEGNAARWRRLEVSLVQLWPRRSRNGRLPPLASTAIQ